MTYYREKAVNYANQWWDGHNPSFRYFEDDCTNYISQCLWTGGVPMVYSSVNNGWWYKGNGSSSDTWSYSWTVAHSLRWYLQNRKSGLIATVKDSPEELTYGDIICYDFEGDGKWNHNTIVTAMDSHGMPLVNAHTINSKHRYWSYEDSYAWTENIKYLFFHINDNL